MDNYEDYTVKVSIRIPIELLKTIDKDGQKNERTRSKQIIYMLKRYNDMKNQFVTNNEDY